MCECGCGSSYNMFYLPAPGGKFYLFEFGPGCQDCETPTGVIVSKVARDTLDDYGVEKLPMYKGMSGNKECPIGFVHAHEVHELLMKKLCDAFGVKNIFDAPGGLFDNFDPDELKEEIYELFRTSLAKSLASVTQESQPDGGER